MLHVILFILIISPIDSIYQSTLQFTSMGLEYQPNNTVQLISTQSIRTQLLCSAQCNQLTTCRIFDYDTVSNRCRLFEGDLTTGSIISSSSLTSVVGSVQISSNLYSSVYNQSCQLCQQNRYETCCTNTSTCQCPGHTYWNGSVCALQLFVNATCGQSNACRSDLNLSCLPDACGYSSRCLPSATYNTTYSTTTGFGTTIAGICNGSASTNQTILINPTGIVFGFNDTLYVGDNSNRLLAFQPNNPTARVIASYPNWLTFPFFDNRTSNIYITILLSNLVYIWPTNVTIPPNGISYSTCSMSWLNLPIGIVVDSVGNVYVSSFYCNWVVKWAPNASNGTLIAGSASGVSGSSSTLLYSPYGLALDESNSFLYVVDRANHRVQRFVLGSPNGVTVAGGNGAGAAPNQFYDPNGIYISKFDGSIYVVDCSNNRIQKWQQNATNGTTVAGSWNGTSGSTPYLLNQPYGITSDTQENYLYVSDNGNSRIQRFSLR